MSPLSKDPLLVSSFSIAQKFFLAAKCLSLLTPSAGRTSSHSILLVLPALELPDKPDQGTSPSNFLSTLFLIHDNFGVA